MYMGLGSLAEDLKRSSVIDRSALDRAGSTAGLEKSAQAALTSAGKQDPGAAAAAAQKASSGFMAIKAANEPLCRQTVERNAALMAALQRARQSPETMIELCSRDPNQFRASVAAMGLEEASSSKKWLWIAGGLLVGGVTLAVVGKRLR